MASKAKTGFSVLCPRCWEAGSVTINLASVGDCSCTNCSEDFTARQALEAMDARVAEWAKVVKWVEMAATVAAE